MTIVCWSAKAAPASVRIASVTLWCCRAGCSTPAAYGFGCAYDRFVLYDPEAHEPLEERPWEESRARRAILEIVTDAEEAFDRERLWPAHPNDTNGELPSAPVK